MSRIFSYTSNVSPLARIWKGTAVLPQTTVGDVELGAYYILASNSLVNSKSDVKEFSNIDCGGIVLKDSKMLGMALMKSGEIYQ